MHKINDYIQSLLHFTDAEQDRMPHHYMLVGFLDCLVASGEITTQQKTHHLNLLDVQITQKLKGEQA